MIEINLLPKELQWKRFRFALDKNILYILAVGTVITLGMGVYSYIFQASSIAGLQEEISKAREEESKYSAEIQKIDEIAARKTQILARMSAIQLLDQNRDYWIDLMEDLVRRVPEYVWLTSVQQAPAVGQTAQQAGAPAAPARSTLKGYSFSLNALATFLVRLKKSDLLMDVELSSIVLQENEESKAYSFELAYSLQAAGPVAPPTEAVQAPGSTGNRF
jgi:type IV pilus assembly protein PilN